MDLNILCCMPPPLTSKTGFDVMAHLAECFVSKRANPITDFYCLKGMKLVFNYLPRAYASGGDLKAREAMALADTFAGWALDTSRAVLPHALSHPISAFYPKIDHGAALAALTPQIMRFNIEKGDEKTILSLFSKIGFLKNPTFFVMSTSKMGSMRLFSTAAAKFDFQAGQENTFGLAYSFFTRNNLLGGMGSLANANGVSAEKIIIDYELIEILERIERGIDLSDEKLAVESIMKVGPAGNYLTDALTLKYLRSDEHFSGNLYDRPPPGTKKVRTMLERAHERVEELIQHHKPKVPEDRLEELERYISKH